VSLEEIKSAVLAGKVVRWRNGGYRVVFSGRGNRFLIECVFNGSCTSLTWSDGVTMSESPSDFFVEEGGVA
jgi:hypothetical protein